MSTSGSSVEQLDLQKQIEEKQKEYENTLID
jgi:hypothetical protein